MVFTDIRTASLRFLLDPRRDGHVDGHSNRRSTSQVHPLLAPVERRRSHLQPENVLARGAEI